MKPIINVEDEPGKTVGRRVCEDAVAYGMKLQSAGKTFQQFPAYRWIPKGVYKFHSHEEADEWMIKMLAKAAVRREKG